MLLYHGTNGAWLDNILAKGIEPRRSRPARDNWKHVAHRSNPRAVYLTDSYAPYFAFNAVRGSAPSCAVVEVDMDLLNPAALLPDEDCWEQLGRNRDGVPGTMSKRTVWYRKQIEKAARQPDPDHVDRAVLNFYTSRTDPSTAAYRISLAALGTCCYRGVVPPSAITRAVRWPHIPNARLTFVWDPMISLMNQQIMGNRYRALTRKLFAGEFIDPAAVTPEMAVAARIDPDAALLPIIEGWQFIDNRTKEAA
jgi:hypothetical protein